MNFLMLEVSIKDFKKIFEGDKDVVYYNITIQSGKEQWMVSKRYSEFEKFNLELSHNHGNMPSMPGKSLIPFIKSDEIEVRRNHLEAYLRVT